MSRAFKETYSDLKIASPVKRLIAAVYDFMLILSLLMVTTGIVNQVFNHGEAVEGPLFQSFLFILIYAFLAYFWMRNGQTLGMMAWRLRVQTTEGYKLNFMQCLLRYLVGWISILCAFAGFIWMFLNKQKMAWHDLASSTHVVELPKGSKILE